MAYYLQHKMYGKKCYVEGKLEMTWLARPWRGPAKPFIPAATDRYGSDNALPTWHVFNLKHCQILDQRCNQMIVKFQIKWFEKLPDAQYAHSHSRLHDHCSMKSHIGLKPVKKLTTMPNYLYTWQLGIQQLISSITTKKYHIHKRSIQCKFWGLTCGWLCRVAWARETFDPCSLTYVHNWLHSPSLDLQGLSFLLCKPCNLNLLYSCWQIKLRQSGILG